MKIKSSHILNIILCLSAVAVSVSISAMEIGLGLLLIILIYKLIKEKRDVTEDCPYLIPFFLYWLTTLLPFFLGSDKAVVENNAFDIWPMLYLFVGFYFVNEKNIRPIMFFLILGCASLGISVIADVALFHKIRGGGFLSYMTGGNVLAIGAILTFATAVSGYEKNKSLLIYYGMACAFMITGIIYTETRGPLLSFLFAACLMLIWKYGLKGVLASAALTTAVGTGVYFSGIGERFFEIFKNIWDVNTSHGWRLELWHQTILLIKEHPIFGIGAGAYESFIREVMPSAGLPLSHAHNGYLVQAVLFGLAGFLAFCWFYGKIFVDFIKKISENHYASIGFFILLVYMLEGLTENNFQDSEVVMYSSLSLGLLLGAIRKNIGTKYDSR